MIDGVVFCLVTSLLLGSSYRSIYRYQLSLCRVSR
jgi:hypothetical protein